MYPVGWPLWKMLARMGVPLRFTLVVHFDSEARVFWAESPDLDGLVVEGADLEEVRREALLAADGLLEASLSARKSPKLRMRPRLDMGSPLVAGA